MIKEKLSFTCDVLLSHQQLACCDRYCGIPYQGKNVLIYSIKEAQQKPLLLTGHHGDISAMTFGKRSSPVTLCSASSEYIIIWDIEACQKRTEEGKLAAGTVIGTLLGNVVHLSFCSNDELVAVCSGTTIYVLNSKRQEVICTLNGHLGFLTSATFCPWNTNVLVSTSEDRTFKVWDLKTGAVFYQSFVLGGSPLLSVLFLEEEEQLITGSTDGQMWCFSLDDDHKCYLVKKMDLQKMEKRYEMRQDTLSQPQDVAEQWISNKVEISKPVIQLASCGSLAEIQFDQEIDNSWFCVGSSNGLYVVELATSELLSVLYFKDNPTLSMTMAGSWSICIGSDKSMIALVSSLFTPCVVLLELFLSNLRRTREEGGSGYSVFPSSPPLLESPLNAELKRKEPSHLKKKGGIEEKPLVFHSKVKSSGYNTTPRMTMFSAQTNVQKKTSPKKGLLHRNYPEDSAAPTEPRTTLNIANKQVSCLQYSGDGKKILCGLGDRSILLYNSCLTGNPTAYIGHDKSVTSVNWSLCRQWWLSAAEDLSLRIWTKSSSEPAIILGDTMFSKPIRGAQFYYLDKFLVLTSGPSLYLYLYNVDLTRDDVKRYKQRSIIKLASCLTPSASDITALSAVNDFLSYIVLVSCSDRSIQVLDMNKGAVGSILPDAHSRAIHCVTQNKGSTFTSQAPESYNLFLTSAVTDGIKMWDLRTMRHMCMIFVPAPISTNSRDTQTQYSVWLSILQNQRCFVLIHPEEGCDNNQIQMQVCAIWGNICTMSTTIYYLKCVNINGLIPYFSLC
ncbi:WD repeat-containing protein 27 isoform X2 [Gambusia affinis]|uniref:WD repeat-containing protein 27 isoform X2 n=1 Tax=Gambusia affinis TaxID=33528 RepID=UPI001CDC0D1A|nr:WD repeat-containing protein 27 isoform X2 [Gambusia affinis]